METLIIKNEENTEESHPTTGSKDVTTSMINMWDLNLNQEQEDPRTTHDKPGENTQPQNQEQEDPRTTHDKPGQNTQTQNQEQEDPTTTHDKPGENTPPQNQEQEDPTTTHDKPGENTQPQNQEQEDPTTTHDKLGENTQPQTISSGFTVTPEDVLCDSCIEIPCRAQKSCLTCLVSYCEAHLRPHLENQRFQNHRLVEPLQDIECRTCEEHRLPLELYCLTDGCGVCVCCECEGQGHLGHSTVPVEEARRQIQTELQKKQGEIMKTVSVAENSIELGGRGTCCDGAAVLSAARGRRRGPEEGHGGSGGGAEAGAQPGRGHPGPPGAEEPRAEEDPGQSGETLQEQEGCRLPAEKLGITTMVHPKMSKSFSLPEPEMRDDFLTYANSLTFDPDTVHKFLRLTEDDRKVTNTTPWQHSYPDTPERFEYWRQVMTSESLYLGRHYFEAELSGEGVHVGLTYKSIDRKGVERGSCITGNDFSWSLGREGRSFSTWHADMEAVVEATNVFMRIGVYIDFDSGSLAFYGVTDIAMILLYRYKAEFMEPLYPTVWLSKKDSVVLLVGPKDPPLMKSSTLPATPITPMATSAPVSPES
ncbi:tripartite motif-containing protein 16-like isoform X2 [Oncorhynchus kisutch]|uniref:tripartite motif-containing protein 16-like isoform X2 n=1 Tax=Oncorhynchus kisutch TaxID=8019 RepID=UPI0012DE2056|nr:tripartite motif-containing protein 16-like isoform X2 [Oncorhynchus kisutch]